jgi:hypothetical protein
MTRFFIKNEKSFPLQAPALNHVLGDNLPASDKDSVRSGCSRSTAPQSSSFLDGSSGF